MGIDFDSENAFVGLDAIGLSAQCGKHRPQLGTRAPATKAELLCA
jgi:hypothetical protein